MYSDEVRYSAKLLIVWFLFKIKFDTEFQHRNQIENGSTT